MGSRVSTERYYPSYNQFILRWPMTYLLWPLTCICPWALKVSHIHWNKLICYTWKLCAAWAIEGQSIKGHAPYWPIQIKGHSYQKVIALQRVTINGGEKMQQLVAIYNNDEKCDKMLSSKIIYRKLSPDTLLTVSIEPLRSDWKTIYQVHRIFQKASKMHLKICSGRED